MRDLGLCYQIIKNTCSTVKIPVSIKLRSSITKLNSRQKITALDLLKKIKDLPVKAVMIHGRCYEQGFLGEIDYTIIKKFKKEFKGIVLANGGVQTVADAKNLLAKTEADGIGLARGVLGKPWLFKQIKQFLAGQKITELNFEQIKKLAFRHASLSYKQKGKQGVLQMRKHLAWYIKAFPGASLMRSELVKAESLNQIKKILS